MEIFGWLLDLLFGSVYGLVILGIGSVAAIPYGIWQGLKRLWAMRPGGAHGDTRTG